MIINNNCCMFAATICWWKNDYNYYYYYSPNRQACITRHCSPRVHDDDLRLYIRFWWEIEEIYINICIYNNNNEFFCFFLRVIVSCGQTLYLYLSFFLMVKDNCVNLLTKLKEKNYLANIRWIFFLLNESRLTRSSK